MLLRFYSKKKLQFYKIKENNLYSFIFYNYKITILFKRFAQFYLENIFVDPAFRLMRFPLDGETRFFILKK